MINAKNWPLLKEKASLYIALTRLNKPVGIFLLLWPTLSALWLAAEGHPSWKLVVIFTLGVTLMRSAGCIINDIADRHLDRKVRRTRNRPLALQRLTVGEALIAFILLILCAFLLVLLTNKLTVLLSIAALCLACTYPFMKRFTNFPQLVLGIAFAMGIPMAFSAHQNTVPHIAWLFFLSTTLWTVAYDTIYAMMDREDDIHAGIKSTAILFGEQDRMIVSLLQALTIVGFFLVGQRAELSGIYYLGLIAMLLNFCWQHWLMHTPSTDNYFKAFVFNTWAGASLYLGIVAHYLFFY